VFPWFPGVVVVVLLFGLTAACAWSFYRPAPVPMEVLLADWRRRAAVRRQLGAGLRRLRRLVRERTGSGVAILIVEWLPDGSRANCQPVRRRGDGGSGQLITVALTVGERRQTADELLAALAERYLALRLGAHPARPTPPPVAAAPERLRELLTDLGARDGRAG
jgi:hypothetical protein